MKGDRSKPGQAKLEVWGCRSGVDCPPSPGKHSQGFVLIGEKVEEGKGCVTDSRDPCSLQRTLGSLARATEELGGQCQHHIVVLRGRGQTPACIWASILPVNHRRDRLSDRKSVV